ncbi:General transcription factor IIE subunit 1 [Forsythia ovata]|uniref:General transcription factor IIE subunit 1 n=1 Tax=Forsythia ovata TaxID=205694 RepID=A0ABD1PH43_9LAMI
MKVLPSWMINQGMNLTAEQRGETKQEAKMADSLPAEGISDDKTPPTDKDDVNIIEDEYLKAYYAALLSRQRDLEADAKREQETSMLPSLMRFTTIPPSAKLARSQNAVMSLREMMLNGMNLLQVAQPVISKLTTQM